MTHSLAQAPLVILLCWAAVTDWTSRRIPNWLTFSLILSGLLVSFRMGNPVPPGSAFEAAGIGFGIGFVLFVLGALKGGDVKLITGVGAWVGTAAMIKILVIEKIVGLIIVLIQSAAQGKLLQLFRNSAVLAVSISQVSELGIKSVEENGRIFRSIDRPLPYAVPMLIATLLVLSGWI